MRSRNRGGLGPLWNLWKFWDYQSDIYKVEERLARCGTSELLRACYDCGTQTVHTLFCSCRICRSANCEKSRNRHHFAHYASIVERFEDPRFLTLSYKGHFELDYAVIRKMDYAFKCMLQQGKREKSLPKFQYVRVVEIMPKEDGFYYHFHLLVDRWLDVNVLRELWSRYADSPQMNIEWLGGAPSLRRTLNYLLKYLRKNLSVSVLDAVSYLEKHFYRHRMVACSISKEISYAVRHMGDYCPFCGQKHYHAVADVGTSEGHFMGIKTDIVVKVT